MDSNSTMEVSLDPFKEELVAIPIGLLSLKEKRSLKFFCKLETLLTVLDLSQVKVQDIGMVVMVDTTMKLLPLLVHILLQLEDSEVQPQSNRLALFGPLTNDLISEKIQDYMILFY